MSEDIAVRAKALERRLRSYKRHIMGAINIKKDPDPQEIVRFKAKLSSCKEYWEEFKTAWGERIELGASMKEEDTFPSDVWDALYDQLRDEIIEANSILLGVQEGRNAEKQYEAHDRTIANTTISNIVKPRLPVISIPTFSGDILKWTHFKDTFESMVNNEPGLSNVEKFHYLIGSLKGEAAALLSRFSIDEQTYTQAWKRVVETYDNPRILASLLIHRIIDCDTKSVKGELQKYEAFLTDIADSIDAFRALKLENPCEFLLATLALRALNPEVRKQFELSLKSSKEYPSADDVIAFIRQRKTALKMSQEMFSTSDNSSTQYRSSYPNRSSIKYNAVALHSAGNSADSNARENSRSPKRTSGNFGQTCSGNTQQGTPQKNRDRTMQCIHCHGNHQLHKCNDFQNLTSCRRVELVRSWKVCWNCLRKGHRVKDCISKFRCRNCNAKHHTLIHEEPKPKNTKTVQAKDTHSALETFIGFGSNQSGQTHNSMVLLGTVRTLIKGHRGDYHSARAVLDSGSQHSFVSSSLVSKLGADISPFAGFITGLAESAVPKYQLKGSITCFLRPCTSDQEFKLQPIVVDRITSSLPSRDLPRSITKNLMHQPLADHRFGESGPIDLLIGGDLYLKILSGAPHYSGIEGLYLLPTVFGLVVAGTLDDIALSKTCTFFAESKSSVERQLKAFWEIEEPLPVSRTNPEDLHCEEHFKSTHYRQSDGRYIDLGHMTPAIKELLFLSLVII